MEKSGERIEKVDKVEGWVGHVEAMSGLFFPIFLFN